MKNPTTSPPWAPQLRPGDRVRILLYEGRTGTVVEMGKEPGLLVPVWLDLPDEEGPPFPRYQCFRPDELGKIDG